jgi:hypothetical protein
VKKEQPFVWGKEQDAAFVKLKEALANASMLAYFDVNVKTQVITDACPVGLGAVLVHQRLSSAPSLESVVAIALNFDCALPHFCHEQLYHRKYC